MPRSLHADATAWFGGDRLTQQGISILLHRAHSPSLNSGLALGSAR